MIRKVQCRDCCGQGNCLSVNGRRDVGPCQRCQGAGSVVEMPHDEWLGLAEYVRSVGIKWENTRNEIDSIAHEFELGMSQLESALAAACETEDEGDK